MIETLDHRDIGKHADYVQNVIGPAVCPKGTGSMYKRGRAVVLASRSHIRPRHVVEAAQNAIRAVDAGTMTINAAYTRIRVATRSDPPVEGAVGDELPAIPPPSPEARSPKARQLRIAWIRALAAKGATTNQIAEKIGIGASAIRRIYKDCGIVNVADAALNRAPVKAVDPNRAMRVILDDLDALVWSLDGIEIDGLDRNETGEWAKALAQYARAIGRVSRKVKGAS